MKKLILLIVIAILSTSTFATEKKSIEIDSPPTCFQQCNTAGSIFREIYGWTAIQFGTWVVGCTNACEANNQ